MIHSTLKAYYAYPVLQESQPRPEKDKPGSILKEKLLIHCEL